LLAKNTPDGFFTAVYQYYYAFKGAADGVISESSERGFLDEYVEIEENKALADKVKNGIIKSGGADFFDEITLALHGGEKNKEAAVFEYLKLFFKYGASVREMINNDAVRAFLDIKRKVQREIERLLGFIRLKETANGVYYGFFSSDNDILEYLAPEFRARFNTTSFVLHDYKRQKAAFYDGRKTQNININGKKTDAHIEIENMKINGKTKEYNEIENAEINGKTKEYNEIENTEINGKTKEHNEIENTEINGKTDDRRKIENAEINGKTDDHNEIENTEINGKTYKKNNKKSAEFYNGNYITYLPAAGNIEIELSGRETAYENLFKEYHKNIAINERENYKLQRAFAPKKYRHFMSEFEE
jgi:probable DNA metabolism protein